MEYDADFRALSMFASNISNVLLNVPFAVDAINRLYVQVLNGPQLRCTTRVIMRTLHDEAIDQARLHYSGRRLPTMELEDNWYTKTLPVGLVRQMGEALTENEEFALMVCAEAVKHFANMACECRFGTLRTAPLWRHLQRAHIGGTTVGPSSGTRTPDGSFMFVFHMGAKLYLEVQPPEAEGGGVPVCRKWRTKDKRLRDQLLGYCAAEAMKFVTCAVCEGLDALDLNEATVAGAIMGMHIARDGIATLRKAHAALQTRLIDMWDRVKVLEAALQQQAYTPLCC